MCFFCWYVPECLMQRSRLHSLGEHMMMMIVQLGIVSAMWEDVLVVIKALGHSCVILTTLCICWLASCDN